jgi:hypothetical protein
MTGAEAFSPSPVFVRQDGSTATADVLLAELQRVAADVRAAIEGHVFPNVDHADVLLAQRLHRRFGDGREPLFRSRHAVKTAGQAAAEMP